ncbi:phosphonate ABC transporter, permease protein PhnE [Pseudodesulfovibrio piezophilus]|uniref:Phosphonate ABC transporter, inner membrane subunit n=1 Tax=Pseudodesulfovibrio piezophilus (strain DSM 21447 / JCM 15486 / C1TLV30) TaxID=1322246 RepID=M1WQW5_PSEP2|nr:phosphonate ABC transporter, permease protein PhnE [Pseudodesulfovibrio piezophilus]CCH47917.1 Phosphonate ABC transporter, inner membrane subunit [Pseudodesulfovibrio piezophilus C1TLV30]
MSQDLTLEQVTPRKSFIQKLALGGLMTLIFAVLVASYISTDIDPFKLYEKRHNAFEYLFGRELNEVDRQSALDQARRLPEIIAFEESYQEVKKRHLAQGQKLDPVAMQREARKIAETRMAAVSPAEREAIVQEEYTRISDEKTGGYFPPETARTHIKEYTIALIETMAIAIWGTLIAFIAAIPMAMFAAKNTLELMIQGDGTHQRIIRWFGQFTARRMLDFCRGFNEFVMALIFVAVIGLGPYAGVLALAIHTFGILGKVFSEAIEQIEAGQVEAVAASGAGPAQIMAFSVIPQVMPLIVSYTLLRFEANVRSATILGFVGAGGIGFLMFDKINGYLYREVCTMMIMVIVSVTLIDYMCGILRRRFV